MPFLRQSTSQVVRFGPCLDIDDGVTEETALTLAQADMRLSKDGGAFAQKGTAGNATHDSDGWYSTTLSTTDTNTVGELIMNVHQPANMLPVWLRWWVIEEAIYDLLYGAAATGLVTLAAATHTGAVIPTVTTLTGHTAQTGDSYARIGAAGASLTAINLPNQTMDITGDITGNVSGSVGSVTGNVGGTVNGLTATALADFFDTDSGATYAGAAAGSVVKEMADNAGGAALTEAGIADAVWDELQSGHVAAGSFGEVATEVASILVDTGTTLPASIAVIDTNVDQIEAAVITNAAGVDVAADIIALKAETVLIVADTNELQTDDIPGAIAALNDPTAAAIADAVWDEDATAHQAGGTFGQAIGDPGANTETMYDAVVTDAAGTNVAADVVAVKAETALILTDTGTTLETHLTDIKGGTFSGATDSLEAVRDRGDAAWTTGAGSGLTPLASGTAQGGTASTIQLASGETFANDELNGNVAKIHTGTGAGQARVITDYAGATDTATVSPNWITTPDATSQYEVVEGSANITVVSNVAEDLPTATALATVDGNVDLILVDTGTTLQGELDAIQAAVITNAAGADIAADIIAVKAETALIVADTNELQGDWVNGGRLDLLLDAIPTTAMRGTDNAATATALATVDANVDLILVDTGTTLQAELDAIQAAVITNAAGVDVAADIIALKAETALIVADTNELQTDNVPGLIAALNDPTAAAIADAVLDEALSGHVTAGTLGKAVADVEVDTNELQGDWVNGGRLDLILDSRMAEASINTTAGAVDSVTLVATTTTNTDMRGTDSAALASVSTEARLAELDAANLPADVDNILTDTGTTLPASIAALNDIAGADVLTQVNAALDTAIAELGVAAPASTPTIRTALMLMYMAMRNRLNVQTSGTDALEIYNNAGTLIAKKLLTDDGSDYSEAKMTSG